MYPLQAEAKGIIQNPVRVDKKDLKYVDLDFKIDGPAPYTFVDIKSQLYESKVGRT
jgi:hypothetical protein